MFKSDISMRSLIKILFILTLWFLFSNLSFGQGGEIHGIITDARNNEVVPFANVVLLGTQKGTVSDINGEFKIDGIEPGFVKLQVSFVGYDTKTTGDIFVSNNNIPYVEIVLEPIEQELSEVVISVDPFEKVSESPLSMQSIGVKEIESNPGSNRDISRVIQSFPGVGSTPAYRNDIIIRGGGPSENRFFLDEVEIPVINHFSTQGASGGPVGIINADFIQTLDFYSGSFPADKYNALSGIMSFKQKEGSKDKTNLQFSVGASETALTLDGPIKEKTSYIFSVRRSYLQFLFSALELPFLPTFNDYQLKVKTNFDRKNQLTIISIGSLDRLKLNTGIKDPDPEQEFILSQIPVNNQWSYTIGAVYRRFFDKGKHTFVLSRNMLDNTVYKYPDNNENLNKSLDYNSQEIENKFRYELTLRNPHIKYVFGANLEYAKYNNTTFQELFINDSLINLRYKTNLELYKYGLSAQAIKRFFTQRLLVSFGVRMDGNTYNSNTRNLFNQLSPRLSLSYSISEVVFLNAGIGRYFQQPAYTTLGFKDNTNELVNKNSAEYIGANHYTLGVEHRFSKAVIFSLEGFYKDYFQYPINLSTGASLANEGADYSSFVGSTAAVFTGEGKAAGFEVLNRVNLSTFTLLASYTFVRSKFTDINGNYIPSSWDSKHLLTLTGSKSLKNNWRVGFKWRFVGGLPYTPYDIETSANVQAWDAKGQAYLDYSRLNEERLKSFHQLDIRIDKNFFFDKWSLMLYLDIQNVYNFKADEPDIVVREKNPDGTYKTVNNGTEYVLERIPSESGTILPTLGIMIKL